MFGSNNCDHQARICHSTTVAGVANTWGYGAMTNSYNDMQNTKCALYIGSNGRGIRSRCCTCCTPKRLGAKMIVVDPRYTRYRGESRRVCAYPLGSDIRFPVRPAASRFQERLGGQEVHQ